MLICIMGNSGAGKDTIIKSMMYHAKVRGINIHQMPSITDRPRRSNELQPDDYEPYIFVTPEQFDGDLVQSDLLEARSYEVNQPGQKYFRYGTCGSNLYSAIHSKDIFVTACVPSQFAAYYNNLSMNRLCHKMYPVFLDVSDRERLLRSINRVDKYDINALREVCRRFYNDTEYINALEVPSRFYVANNDVDETANFILDLAETFIDTDWESDVWYKESTDKSVYGALLVDKYAK